LDGQKAVGKYLMLETLGIGTFATVKKALHTETKQRFAIKIIEKDSIEEADLQVLLLPSCIVF
jgi:serine/threonine protein kinase